MIQNKKSKQLLLFHGKSRKHHSGVVRRAVKKWADRKPSLKKVPEENRRRLSNRMAILEIIDSLPVPSEKKNRLMQMTRQSIRLDELIEFAKAGKLIHKPKLIRVLRLSRGEAVALLQFLDLQHESKLIDECRNAFQEIDHVIDQMKHHVPHSTVIDQSIVYRLRRIHDAFIKHEFGEHNEEVVRKMRSAKKMMHKI